MGHPRRFAGVREMAALPLEPEIVAARQQRDATSAPPCREVQPDVADQPILPRARALLPRDRDTVNVLCDTKQHGQLIKREPCAGRERGLPKPGGIPEGAVRSYSDYCIGSWLVCPELGTMRKCQGPRSSSERGPRSHVFQKVYLALSTPAFASAITALSLRIANSALGMPRYTVHCRMTSLISSNEIPR